MLPAVEAYISAAPEALREQLRELREMIVAANPKAVEEMYMGQFPVYTIGGDWVGGLAWRSKGCMLYLMDQKVVEKHAAALGSLASGKACLVYKRTKALDGAALKALFAQLLREAAANRQLPASITRA